MKLNNKGFAISTVMYLILVAAVILITLTLSLLSSRKLILDKIRNESKENIYNVYDITYRQALETLKQEYLDYLNTNNITTTKSIKIGDLETSIDSNIINGYNLNDKYLTNIGSSVYLGKSKTITDISTTQDKFIDIYDAKIYGNSYQQTYTGKNLFDLNKLHPTELGTNYVGGDSYMRNYAKIIDDVVEIYLGANQDAIFLRGSELVLKTNETITISADVAIFEQTQTTDNNVIFRIVKKGDNSTRQETIITLPSREEYYRVSATFTVSEEGEYLIGLLPYRGYTGKTKTDVRFKNIQIEYGSNATAYEPYVGGTPSPNPEYPQEVKSVGELVTNTNDSNYGKYKIPIKISNKNLIDTSKLSYGYIKSDGTIEDVNGYMHTDYIEVSGDYLTYSKTGDSSSTSRYFAFYDESKSFISGDVQKTDDDGSDYYTIDIPEGAKYFRLNVAPNYLEQAMVELGNNYTGYEPSINTINIYLNEPLRKIGDSTDYVDSGNSKVARYTNEKVFDGTQIWNGASTEKNNWGGINTVGFYVYSDGSNGTKVFSPYFAKVKSMTLNTHFSYYKHGQHANEVIAASNPNNYYSMRIGRDLLSRYGSDNSSVDDNKNAFNAWLADNYNSGNPVKVSYELKDPYEESITLPTIDFGEYNKISIDTEIKPSKVEFTVIEKIKEI